MDNKKKSGLLLLIQIQFIFIAYRYIYIYIKTVSFSTRDTCHWKRWMQSLARGLTDTHARPSGSITTPWIIITKACIYRQKYILFKTSYGSYPFLLHNTSPTVSLWEWPSVTYSVGFIIDRMENKINKGKNLGEKLVCRSCFLLGRV